MLMYNGKITTGYSEPWDLWMLIDQAKHAKLKAEKRDSALRATLRREKSGQAGIRSKQKQQEYSGKQDSNIVNSNKSWESKVPIKRDSDNLENVIKGEKPG
jgi:hypothetical protein